jgi:hypothetical protein
VEARRRFDSQVFPRLADSSLSLTVRLVLREQSSDASLGEANYLAYEPLRGYPARDHHILFFSGDPSQAAFAEQPDKKDRPAIDHAMRSHLGSR